MSLPVVATVTREPYAQTRSAGNVLADSWGPAGSVDTFGWWVLPPVADTHRNALITTSMLIPRGTTCATKDRWTVDGTTFYQVGAPEDYNHGPWGATVPLVVHLASSKW